jgi:hypothetical protein
MIGNRMASLFLSNAVELFLQCKSAQGRDRQAKEKTDAPIERSESLAEGAVDLFGEFLRQQLGRESPSAP